MKAKVNQVIPIHIFIHIVRNNINDQQFQEFLTKNHPLLINFHFENQFQWINFIEWFQRKEYTQSENIISHDYIISKYTFKEIYDKYISSNTSGQKKDNSIVVTEEQYKLFNYNEKYYI